MRHSLLTQTLLHLPHMSFLLLLAAAVFLLPKSEVLPPLQANSVASDIVWSRHTTVGETLRLSAGNMQRAANGVVNVEGVKVNFSRDGREGYLSGPSGYTNIDHSELSLTDASGAFDIGDSARITLSLALARYALDGSRLRGENVQLRQQYRRLDGDELLWDNETLRIRGNVRAHFTVREK